MDGIERGENGEEEFNYKFRAEDGVVKLRKFDREAFESWRADLGVNIGWEEYITWFTAMEESFTELGNICEIILIDRKTYLAQRNEEE